MKKMMGKLDPEENVMKDIPLGDITKHDLTMNRDKFFAYEENGIMDCIQDFIETLNWEENDDIVVELGGTQVSGIEQPEEYNKKWASPFGHRKYNKDAFIVISNQSRRDLTRSQPMDREHKPAHPYEAKK
tara:strand:- start:409 stop:798 length:390 start_codon:yes stop_codon:yes gene_type:complete